MKKLLLTLVAIFAVANVSANRCGMRKGCHEKKPCHDVQVTEACKPKCVKRCVVEKCVAPIRHEEKIVTYSCPTDCETAEENYQPMHKDVTRKGRRMMNS